MDEAIKRLDATVMAYGKIITEVEKDIRLLSRAENTFGMDPKQVKKIKIALITTSAYYVKKQEIIALEVEQIKDM